jgi:hypothetical protein
MTKLQSLLLSITMLFAFGCATTGSKLADVATPSRTVIDAARQCVGTNIDKPEIVSFCLSLAKDENDRAKSTANSAAEAQKNDVQANPCPLGCYVVPNNVYGYSSGLRAVSGPTRDYSRDQPPPPKVETRPAKGTVTIGTTFTVHGGIENN